MGLQISEELNTRFFNIVRFEPLNPTEVRRIEGVGGLYISKISKENSPSEYVYLYSIEIDDCSYFLYAKR